MKNAGEDTKSKIKFLYGTAWKEDLTEEHVFNALRAGYRAIDTANQRKHYYEEGVGNALSRGYAELKLRREELFLQSKFTYARGQDHRKPYDERAPLKEQVSQSFQSSLQHLRTEYLDSFLLHGPSTSRGLTDMDWEVWQSMEAMYDQGKAKHLGASNMNLEQLVELYQNAKIKPAFLQNRCFAETKWDQRVRTYCLEKGIYYQGFSLLTANTEFLGGIISPRGGREIPHVIFSNQRMHKRVQAIVEETKKTIEQIVFRFSQQVGIIPITGTRSEAHMKSDLDIADFTLTPSQLETIENIAFLK